MSTDTTRKPAPAQLAAPLTLTLDALTLGDLNAYRQATYAEQWPPAELAVDRRQEFIEQQRQLSGKAAIDLAMALNDLVTRQLGDPSHGHAFRETWRLQLEGYVCRLRDAERCYYRAQSTAQAGELEILRQELERARIEACGWLKTLHDEGAFVGA